MCTFSKSEVSLNAVMPGDFRFVRLSKTLTVTTHHVPTVIRECSSVYIFVHRIALELCNLN